MRGLPQALVAGCVVVLSIAPSSGCSRVQIVTGTTLGLKATPGDGNSRPPQVTLGYKRAELALIPTNRDRAHRDPEGNGGTDSDAFSTLAAFRLSTEWFGNTEVSSFIATGHASRNIQARESKFNEEFAVATLGVVPDDIGMRQSGLSTKVAALSGAESEQMRAVAGCPMKVAKTSKQSLEDCIKDAQTDAKLVVLESALGRLH